MGAYRKEWGCCGSVSETQSYEPEECPFCSDSRPYAASTAPAPSNAKLTAEIVLDFADKARQTSGVSASEPISLTPIQLGCFAGMVRDFVANGSPAVAQQVASVPDAERVNRLIGGIGGGVWKDGALTLTHAELFAVVSGILNIERAALAAQPAVAVEGVIEQRRLKGMTAWYDVDREDKDATLGTHTGYEKRIVYAAPPLAASTGKTGELPALPDPVRMSSDQSYLGYTADQMRAYAELAIASTLAPSAEEVRDAARYRWLRHADLNALADANWGIDGQVYEGDQFDAAIDEAMKRTTTDNAKEA